MQSDTVYFGRYIVEEPYAHRLSRAREREQKYWRDIQEVPTRFFVVDMGYAVFAWLRKIIIVTRAAFHGVLHRAAGP